MLKVRGEARTGFGFALYTNGQLVHTDSGRLGKAEVYDAEAEGARAALRQAIQHATSLGTTPDIYICLDNVSVIRCLNGTPPNSSRSTFMDFRRLQESYNGIVTPRWAPGHMGIEGNEKADELAKLGASGDEAIAHPPTEAYLRRQVKDINEQAFRRWWQEAAHGRYKGFHLKASLKPTPELRELTRKELHWLLAARSGHGDFAEYHIRFKHHDAELNCKCGKHKSPAHPLTCPKVKKPPMPSTRSDITRLLGADWRKYTKRLRMSEYHDTAGRREPAPSLGYNAAFRNPSPARGRDAAGVTEHPA